MARPPARPRTRGLLQDPMLTLANSRRLLALFLVTLILVAAVLHSILEDSSIGDGLWWAVVTASTVGYGDISPATLPGRIVAGSLISAMVLLVVPLFIAHIINRLVQDANEFTHEEQEQLKRQHQQLLAAQQELHEIVQRLVDRQDRLEPR